MAHSHKNIGPNEFEILQNDHLEKLAHNADNWQQIEQDTKGQSECEQWHLLRRKMLTASNFGTVCRMRPQHLVD